ncbi:MAG: DNA-directed RNA polymerase subunit alpha C-terminal domain-containing protein [Candidatus Bipolaricaulia bacterium]
MPDDQLSLAIGKGGQNARLAAKLTGWRIDIKSATEAAEEALQKARQEEIARVAAVAEKKDILALAEAILMRKEKAPPTAKELRVLGEAIDVIETVAAQERAKEGVPIEVLGLSSRVYNSLNKAGITRVEDILEKLAEGDGEMLAIKNFGPKSLAELKEKLQAEGFVPVEGEAPIEVLGLSPRVYNCLERAGIATVGEILERLAEGDENMLAIKNFGPKSLVELKEKLQAKGFVPVEEVEKIEAVIEEPVEAVKEEVTELAVPEAEEVTEVAEEVAEAAPVEEEIPAEEVEPAEELLEEEPTLEYEKEEIYEYEEEDELEERRKKEKKRELVYDEELGKVVAKRHRKPSRRREEWEEYY